MFRADHHLDRVPDLAFDVMRGRARYMYHTLSQPPRMWTWV